MSEGDRLEGEPRISGVGGAYKARGKWAWEVSRGTLLLSELSQGGGEHDAVEEVSMGRWLKEVSIGHIKGRGRGEYRAQQRERKR